MLQNIVLVSHCDFTGNSALHVHAIASELAARGRSPLVAVPEGPETALELGPVRFPVKTYDELRIEGARFVDGGGPDLVYAFSPRELVRELTVELVRHYGCRYLVHLEDNDQVVLAGELGGADVERLRLLPLPLLDRLIYPRQLHPLRGERFLAHAAGITVILDRLLELVPRGVAAAVIGAGFDERVLAPRRARDDVRADLRLEPTDCAVIYTGNVHALNRGEMRDLYEAIAELRKQGRQVVLVKTGWGSGVAVTFPVLGNGIRDLGWVERAAIPDLLAAADVLVQPGSPGPFNDYRLPSKLPEFLASGRPVVLPRTNLGLRLRDGEEALLLERGDAAEISQAVSRLADDPHLRERLGEGGQAFALRELRWTQSVDALERLLAEVEASRAPAAPAWLLEGADPPVYLVALLAGPPEPERVELLHASGVFAVCIPASTFDAIPLGYRLCLLADGAMPAQLEKALMSPTYLRVGSTPLLVSSTPWSASGRADVERAAGEAVFLVQIASGSPPGQRLVADAFLEPIAGPSKSRGSAGSLETLLRSVRPRLIATPADVRSEPDFQTWLRKLVLQAALRGTRGGRALVFIDARGAADNRWIEATRRGVRDGLRQYYASRGIELATSDFDQLLADS